MDERVRFNYTAYQALPLTTNLGGVPYIYIASLYIYLPTPHYISQVLFQFWYTC